MNITKRFLSLVMALVLLAGMFPGAIPAVAVLGDGICETHHPIHDADCGYVAAVEGADCTHQCGEDCKMIAATNCVHDHTASGCVYTEAVEAVDCDHTHSECSYVEGQDAVLCTCSAEPQHSGECASVTAENAECNCTPTVTHAENCTPREKVDPVACNHVHGESCSYQEATGESWSCHHVCTAENGCITKVCAHQHDDSCGYVAKVEGNPCKFAGSECAQCADGCDENCMQPGNHEGECVLFCSTEYCALAQGHEGDCAMYCGCPATEPEHLESCELWVSFADPLPMVARVSGGDGENITYTYSDSITLRVGSEEPWMQFVAPTGSGGYSDVFSGFSIVDQTVATFTYNGDYQGAIKLTGVKAGKTTLTHTEGNVTYSIPVTVTDGRVLTAKIENTSNIDPRLSMQVGDSLNVFFFLCENVDGNSYFNDAWDGTFETTNSEFLTVQKYDNPKNMCRITALQAGNAEVKFTSSNGVAYTLPVTIENALYAKVNDENIYDLTLTTGAETSLQFFLTGVEDALSGLTAENDMISLTAGENGFYTLEAIHQGISSIKYTDENGKEYTLTVTVMDPMVSSGYLYHNGSDSYGNNYPVTCIDLPVGREYRHWFYFNGNLLSIEDSNFSCSGAIEATAGPDGMIIITAKEEGTGYLEYLTKDSEDGPVITNCFVVNVTSSGNQTPTGTRSGSYMKKDGTVIGFGDIGLGVDDVETMRLDHEVTNAFNNSYYAPFQETALLAAIGIDGQPDVGLINSSISNVKFSVLSCVYNDGAPTAENRLRVSGAEWSNISNHVKTWKSTYTAGEKVAFQAKLGMQFDLQDGDTIRRISLYTSSHNVFMGDEVRVIADDIDSAAELNVILSSRDSLLKWIKEKVDTNTGHPDNTGLEYAENAATINIILPEGNFTDTVVVTQAIGDYPFTEKPIATPDFRITLEGQGSGTVLAGLISKGSLFAVNNIRFQSSGAGETCGILADPYWSGNVSYDSVYYEKYAVNPGVRKLSDWGSDIANWHCDVLTVNYCTFDGFTYGTYSGANGYVGSGVGNTFKNCVNGIYIDSGEKSGWQNLKSYSDYSGYTFINNTYAVRIKSLQQNMSPYEFRIHDCDFIGNSVEFAIDRYPTQYRQNYYFYRNHYRSGDGPHRAPVYHVYQNGEHVGNGNGVNISGTPGRPNANMSGNRAASGEGYWIYDGEDQVTRILSGEDLPIAQEALTALESDTTVSVVSNNDESTIAVWTFEGGDAE